MDENKELEELIEKLEEDPEENGMLRFSIAEKYFDLKKYEEASDYYLIFLFNIVVWRRNLDKNSQLFEKILRTETTVYKQLSICYFELGDLNEAIKTLKNAYITDEDPDLYRQMAIFYKKSGYEKTANEYTRKADKLEEMFNIKN